MSKNDIGVLEAGFRALAKSAASTYTNEEASRCSAAVPPRDLDLAALTPTDVNIAITMSDPTIFKSCVLDFEIEDEVLGDPLQDYHLIGGPLLVGDRSQNTTTQQQRRVNAGDDAAGAKKRDRVAALTAVSQRRDAIAYNHADGAALTATTQKTVLLPPIMLRSNHRQSAAYMACQSIASFIFGSGGSSHSQQQPSKSVLKLLDQAACLLSEVASGMDANAEARRQAISRFQLNVCPRPHQDQLLVHDEATKTVGKEGYEDVFCGLIRAVSYYEREDNHGGSSSLPQRGVSLSNYRGSRRAVASCLRAIYNLIEPIDLRSILHSASNHRHHASFPTTMASSDEIQHRKELLSVAAMMNSVVRTETPTAVELPVEPVELTTAPLFSLLSSVVEESMLNSESVCEHGEAVLEITMLLMASLVRRAKEPVQQHAVELSFVSGLVDAGGHLVALRALHEQTYYSKIEDIQGLDRGRKMTRHRVRLAALTCLNAVAETPVGRTALLQVLLDATAAEENGVEAETNSTIFILLAEMKEELTQESTTTRCFVPPPTGQGHAAFRQNTIDPTLIEASSKLIGHLFSPEGGLDDYVAAYELSSSAESSRGVFLLRRQRWMIIEECEGALCAAVQRTLKLANKAEDAAAAPQKRSSRASSVGIRCFRAITSLYGAIERVAKAKTRPLKPLDIHNKQVKVVHEVSKKVVVVAMSARRLLLPLVARSLRMQFFAPTPPPSVSSGSETAKIDVGKLSHTSQQRTSSSSPASSASSFSHHPKFAIACHDVIAALLLTPAHVCDENGSDNNVEEESVHEVAMKCGIPERILESLSAHLDNPYVQASGYLLLWSLASGPDGEEKVDRRCYALVTMGALQAVMTGLLAHEASAIVVRAGLARCPTSLLHPAITQRGSSLTPPKRQQLLQMAMTATITTMR
jgi:hypothetical protein